MFRKDPYSFSDKTHSAQGAAATLMAIVSLIIIIFLVVWSGLNNGELSLVYGLIGMIGFLLAFAGMVLSVSSFHDENAFMTFKYTGLISNGIMLLIMIAVMVIGFLG